MEYELTIEALADLPEERYALFDIRDEISFEYGTIPGAENAPDILSLASNGLLPRAMGASRYSGLRVYASY